MNTAKLILLLATVVLVPLARKLIGDRSASEREQRLWRIIDFAQWPAALLLLPALFLPQSIVAALLATPWLAVTILCGVSGVLRSGRQRFVLSAQRLQDLGLVYLIIGGAWTMIACGGWRPNDFSDAIVLLTGVHFHYAGFLLPVLASRVAMNYVGWRASVLSVSIALGVPLVGVGITFSPLVEVLAAMLLVLACMAVAVGQLIIAAHVRNGTELCLLLVSSCSLLTAMALAATYALGEFTGHAWLSIDTMIVTHGWANSLGFAGAGLWAWQQAGGASCGPVAGSTSKSSTRSQRRDSI